MHSRISGESTRLGRGQEAAFSPTGRTVAWSDGDTVQVRDLDTGADEVFPVRGTLNGYVSEHQILLGTLSSDRVLLDLTNGMTAQTNDSPYELIPVSQAGSTRLFVDRPLTSPERKAFTITRPSTAALTFSGVFAAALADEQLLILAVPATDETAVVNLVLVDFASNATERLLGVEVGEQIQLPLAATRGRVAWTQRYCGPDPEVRYMDLSDRVVHATDLDGWVSVTPDRYLALGDGFSTTHLVDPETETVLLAVERPSGSGIRWDSAYRLVLAKPEQGHGTACPGT